MNRKKETRKKECFWSNFLTVIVHWKAAGVLLLLMSSLQRLWVVWRVSGLVSHYQAERADKRLTAYGEDRNGDQQLHILSLAHVQERKHCACCVFAKLPSFHLVSLWSIKSQGLGERACKRQTIVSLCGENGQPRLTFCLAFTLWSVGVCVSGLWMFWMGRLWWKRETDSFVWPGLALLGPGAPGTNEGPGSAPH